ncbi:MAG: zinc-ribbon domain-containing protein [Candidatus Aminicenantes bacterium]|nr:zinc-ribbon domain-containing protein [Candidatus Aminicenantes bacterium]
MFFFIGGIQPKTALLDKNPRSCPECGHLELYIKRTDNYLSLFFIPLFPVKKGTPFMVCENCGTRFTQQGSPLESSLKYGQRSCSHCSRSVGPDFEFCPYCGKPL